VLDFLNMGFPLFGGAVINTYMLRQITMERSTYGLGFTLLNLFVGLPSIVVAASILKWGIRASFAIGSSLIFVGALWMAFFAYHPWQFLIGFGVIIATGISFATIVPVTTAVTRWFHRYRGRAMAIPLAASGFAGFVGAPLVNKILAANGGNWRQAWEVVAGIAIASAAIAVLFVQERPEDLGQPVDGIAEEAQGTQLATAKDLVTKLRWTASQAYKTRAYWLIVVGGSACQFPYFFFIAHWLLHLRQRGINAADAAWAMGLFTLGAIVGRLIGGWLMDKIPGRFAFMSGLSCYFLGSVFAIQVSASYFAIVVAAGILYGAGFGWTFVCMNTMTAHYYGPAAFPKVNGTMLLLTGIVSAPAGLVGGRLFDRYGTYAPAFDLNMLIVAVGIVALAFAPMPRLQPGLPKASTKYTVEELSEN